MWDVLYGTDVTSVAFTENLSAQRPHFNAALASWEHRSHLCRKSDVKEFVHSSEHISKGYCMRGMMPFCL